MTDADAKNTVRNQVTNRLYFVVYIILVSEICVYKVGFDYILQKVYYHVIKILSLGIN